MHSTSTSYAGLPLVFKLVKELNLDQSIEDANIKNRKTSPTALVLLTVVLKIVGITRISHINQVGDFLLCSLLGIKTLPDQSNLHRFLATIDRVKAKHIFSQTTQGVVDTYKIKGKVIAVDAHVIPYYGEKSPLAKRVYMPTKNRCIPGFKLVCAFDVKSGVILAYRLLPGNVDAKRILPRLLNDVWELLPERRMQYLLIDKGFFDGKLFSYLAKTKTYFVIPATRYASVKRALFSLSDTDKYELVFEEKVVETTYRPRNSKQKLRLIFKFIPYGRKGADCLFEFLSNDERLAAESILRLYSKRWRLENAFAELKNELHIDKVPGSSFAKINAHIALTLLAYNLSVCLKSRIAKLAKVRIATLRLKLINIQAALKQAAGLVYVDAVFKEHRHEVASDADPWRLTTS